MKQLAAEVFKGREERAMVVASGCYCEPPSVANIRVWAFVALGCAGVLLVEALVISYLLRDFGKPFWRRMSFLVPVGLASLLLLLAQRAWSAAGRRITIPAGVGEEACVVPLDTFAIAGMVASDVSALTLLGGTLHVLVEKD